MIYDDEYFNSKQFQDDIEMSCCNREGEDYNAIKGGQHTGFHFDGIRLKHIPTGIITESVSERSQFKNRDKAIEELKEKLRGNGLMETIETIIQWHKETFPDTTLEEQEQKFLIEFDEYIEAIGKDEQTKELADMQIVSCGIARFNRERSQTLTNKVLKYAKKFRHNLDDLYKAVQDKMAINRKRKWHKVNGEYRHI